MIVAVVVVAAGVIIDCIIIVIRYTSVLSIQHDCFCFSLFFAQQQQIHTQCSHSTAATAEYATPQRVRLGVSSTIGIDRPADIRRCFFS